MSACSSAKPGNTLPHVLRAQTAASSLAATLDVLSRFITSALQPGWGAPLSQAELASEVERQAPPAAAEQARPVQFAAAMPAAPVVLEPEPIQEPAPEPAPAVLEETLRAVASETEASERTAAAEFAPRIEVPIMSEQTVAEAVAQLQPVQTVVERPVFDLGSLPADQQELHRRANRVAKVSMQDIKMLRPGDVRAGKENNDLCVRLRDDIERAHKEYERRFHAILDHPVDYFYAWMVEILGEGDPRSLGEYPYPSLVARR